MILKILDIVISAAATASGANAEAPAARKAVP
jgi:hypothetical protein